LKSDIATWTLTLEKQHFIDDPSDGEHHQHMEIDRRETAERKSNVGIEKQSPRPAG